MFHENNVKNFIQSIFLFISYFNSEVCNYYVEKGFKDDCKTWTVTKSMYKISFDENFNENSLLLRNWKCTFFANLVKKIQDLLKKNFNFFLSRIMQKLRRIKYLYYIYRYDFLLFIIFVIFYSNICKKIVSS